MSNEEFTELAQETIDFLHQKSKGDFVLMVGLSLELVNFITTYIVKEDLRDLNLLASNNLKDFLFMLQDSPSKRLH